MDGQTAPTLYAWSLAAAGTHDRRHYSVFLRPAHLLGMRVRRRHVRAGVDRIVQRGYWACADPELLSCLRPKDIAAGASPLQSQPRRCRRFLSKFAAGLAVGCGFLWGADPGPCPSGEAGDGAIRLRWSL